jgi:hypothetical protein
LTPHERRVFVAVALHGVCDELAEALERVQPIRERGGVWF